MKKKILIILLLLLICCACGVTKNIIRSGKGDLVLEYTSSSAFGNASEKEVYFIRLYDDKTISTGYNDTIKNKIDVSDDDYQKIIDYAFSSSFTNLKEDLTDGRVMDGSSNYITLFFEDGTSKKYGGLNPTNKKFVKLYEMLEGLLEEEEK